MNSEQRLYVTPEERARRMAERRTHPHGGEGRCGGNEGHGTPELQRKIAERGDAALGKQNSPAPKPPIKAEQSKPAVKADTRSGGVSRGQLASAMRLSFALGEPACRRYGLPSMGGRKKI